MAVQPSISGISSPSALQSALVDAQYLADDALSTSVYLALALGKPMLLETATAKKKAILANAPNLVSPEIDAAVRAQFNIVI